MRNIPTYESFINEGFLTDLKDFVSGVRTDDDKLAKNLLKEISKFQDVRRGFGRVELSFNFRYNGYLFEIMNGYGKMYPPDKMEPISIKSKFLSKLYSGLSSIFNKQEVADRLKKTQEKAKLKISIDLTNLQVEFPQGHTKKIELFGDVGVIMRYPSFDMMSKMDNLNVEDVDGIFDIIASSIDIIYQGEEIYYAKEQSKEELLEFLYNLTNEQFANLQKFFSKMPKISKTVEYNCPLCGKHHSVTLEGMQSFF